MILENILKKYLEDNRCIAVGECGLDYYRLPENKDETLKEKELQKQGFIAQIELAIEFDLPFIFDIKPVNTIKLKKLVYLICTSAPFELNITKLAQKIEINRNTLYQYLYYLAKGDIFILLDSKTRGDNIFVKPQKIYLKNPNLNYCYCDIQQIGTIKETFFANQLFEHQLLYPSKGDFLVDNAYVFEIGGKNKTIKQIKNIENSYLVIDDIEIGSENKIPLWLFGFLY